MNHCIAYVLLFWSNLYFWLYLIYTLKRRNFYVIAFDMIAVMCYDILLRIMPSVRINITHRFLLTVSHRSGVRFVRTFTSRSSVMHMSSHIWPSSNGCWRRIFVGFRFYAVFAILSIGGRETIVVAKLNTIVHPVSRVVPTWTRRTRIIGFSKFPILTIRRLFAFKVQDSCYDGTEFRRRDHETT